tara:strand:- start:15 stop:626 length:612 start_codon:yes stop_codon:yes gene_type:complete
MRIANAKQVRIEKRDGQPTKIVGYAAVFYRADDPGTQYELYSGHVERIKPGAFKRAIEQADDVRGLFNHEPSQILGRTKSGTMRLSEDETGLRYEIDVPDTQVGRDVVTSIERGDVTGSSFAFAVSEGGSEIRKDGQVTVREISGVTLYDSGPVSFPAYDATTTGLRAIDGIDEARVAFEQFEKEQRAVEVRARMIALENDGA